MAWRPTPSPLHARLLDTCSLTVLAFSALSSFPDRPLERAWAWGGVLRSTRSVLFESRLEPFQVASEAEAEAGDLRTAGGEVLSAQSALPPWVGWLLAAAKAVESSAVSVDLACSCAASRAICSAAVPQKEIRCVPELLDVHPCISPSICITV